jgi:hypothetical protein
MNALADDCDAVAQKPWSSADCCPFLAGSGADRPENSFPGERPPNVAFSMTLAMPINTHRDHLAVA